MARSLMTMMAFTLVIALAFLPTKSDSTVAILQSMYEWIRTQDNTFFAVNVVTQDTTRLIPEASFAFGTQDLTLNYLNQWDTAHRMNSLSETLVTMAVLKLVDETVLPSLDTAIPATYLPRGLPFFNPSASGTLLTLRMLLTHTSTITDSKFENFKTTSPSTTTTLAAFIEDYFLLSSGGTFSVASDIWWQATPGLASSYRYAKVNIALAAYIVQQAVIVRPTLVATGSQTTVAAYIQEKILNPLGMSSTYLATLNGGFPTTSYPAGSAFLTGTKRLVDYDSSGTALTTYSIHPAYPADYMYFTTATDVGRLMRALFLDTNGVFKSQGTIMKNSPFTVDSTISTVHLTQTMQAQSLVFFNGAEVCAYALASSVISVCPLAATSSVWGMIAAGQYGQTGYLCTDTASTTNPTCVNVQLAHYDVGSTRKSLQYLLGMAAVAFQSSIGDSTTVTSTGGDEDNSDRFYAMFVIFGIIGVIIFVFLASFITENLIQPAPVATGVPMPTAAAAQRY